MVISMKVVGDIKPSIIVINRFPEYDIIALNITVEGSHGSIMILLIQNTPPHLVLMTYIRATIDTNGM